MTDKQKSITQQLRHSGNSYAQIAEVLNLPVGSIKTFCHRNNLTESDVSQHKENSSGFCKQCRNALMSLPKQKPKQFCSDKCRLKWWNANRDKVNRINAHKLVCATCGDKFNSYDVGRKYCSHACYISHRFPSVIKRKERNSYDTGTV